MRKILSHLAYKLCEISSVSFDELGVISYAAAWLKKIGMTVELIGDVRRPNIFAYYKKQTCYSVIFCTHLDTVAPHINPRLEAEILWGRGACDAKGIAACMIMAVLEQKQSGFEDLALLLTVGEEETSDGAKACHPVLTGRAQYLVVGEPTELKAAYAQKGSLVFDITATGIEAHSAMPELGVSAINQLIDAIYALSHTSWPANQNYGSTLFNAGFIAGGSMRNILAKSAQAQCVMRLSEPAHKVINIIKTKISPKIALNILSSSDPFLYVVPPGFDSFLAGFGSDAPYLSQLGQPILLGPGSLTLAHQALEHIRISELLEGLDAYQKIAVWARSEKDI